MSDEHTGEPEAPATSNVRIPMAVCAAVAEVLSGSHSTLDALFQRAGAPGPPPDLAHHSKWKTWLFNAGINPAVDSLAVLGNLLEEFMDLPPAPRRVASVLDAGIEVMTEDPVEEYWRRRDRLNEVLDEHGLRYYRGGRVLPVGNVADAHTCAPFQRTVDPTRRPESVEELLATLIRGLPRAMHPLTHRRSGAHALTFQSEYDIQDLLHSQMRPWIADIRPEEYTPSYAGSSARMDFLLPAHRLVLEIKRVRSRSHATTLGNELIIDIEHYRRHPACDRLWCVVYDPGGLLPNPEGLTKDLGGQRRTPDGSVFVQVFVFGAPT